MRAYRQEISTGQVAVLILAASFVLSSIRIGYIGFRLTGRSNWLFSLLGGLLSLVGLWSALRLQRRGLTLLDALPWSGWRMVTGLAAGLFSTVLVVYVNRHAIDLVRVTLLPGTSSLWLSLINMAVAGYAAWIGVERAMRGLQAAGFFAGGLLLVLSLLPLQMVNAAWLVPWFEGVAPDSWLPGIVEGIYPFSTTAVLPLLPARGDRKSERLAYLGLAGGLVVVLLHTLMGMAKFGVETLITLKYPFISLIDAVRVENFVVERLLFGYLVLWYLLAMIVLGIILQAGAYGLSRAVGKPQTSPWAILVMTVVAVLALQFMRSSTAIVPVQMGLSAGALLLSVLVLPLAALLSGRRQS